MEEVFDKDEIRYLRWAAEHRSDGLIVNTDLDRRSPLYAMVHRASHRLVTSMKMGNFYNGTLFPGSFPEMSDLEA